VRIETLASERHDLMSQELHPTLRLGED